MFGWLRRKGERVERRPWVHEAPRVGVVKEELDARGVSRREAIVGAVGAGVAVAAAGKMEFKTREVPVPRQTAEIMAGCWGSHDQTAFTAALRHMPTNVCYSTTDPYVATVSPYSRSKARPVPYIEGA